MSAPAVEASGETTSDGTVQTLFTITTPGVYCLHFNTVNNASGDTVDVFFEETFGGLTNKLDYASYVNATAEPKIRRLYAELPAGGTVKMQRTAGSARAYDWQIVRLA